MPVGFKNPHAKQPRLSREAKKLSGRTARPSLGTRDATEVLKKKGGLSLQNGSSYAARADVLGGRPTAAQKLLAKSDETQKDVSTVKEYIYFFSLRSRDGRWD